MYNARYHNLSLTRATQTVEDRSRVAAETKAVQIADACKIHGIAKACYVANELPTQGNSLCTAQYLSLSTYIHRSQHMLIGVRGFPGFFILI